MNKIVLVLLFALVFASPAYSQSVNLPVQVRGDSEAWIHIKPTKVDGGAPKWRIDPGLEEVLPDSFLPPEAAKVFIGKLVKGPPGKYKVESWNAKGDVASEISTCWVVIGGVVPPPTPPPAPPAPPPQPKKVASHVTFIGAELTPASLATNNDTALRAWLDVGFAVKVHVFKNGDAGIATAGLTAAVAKAGGAPCIVIQDEVGNVIAQGTMTTVQAAKDLITPFVKR